MQTGAPELRELRALADACVQCGACLPHCPTHADAGVETESPRGRILLAAAIGNGRLSAAEADAELALSHCLGCRACEAMCPAKVDYGRVLHLSRQLLRRERPPPLWQRGLEWLLAQPGWLRRAARLAALLGRLPGAQRWLPRPATAAALPRMQAAEGPPRGRLALVQGCVAAHWEAEAHRAALRLLARLGWEVVVLDPACCGALHRHGGAAERAAALRSTLAARIAASGAGAVIHAGSGCHEAIAEAARGRPTHELCAFIADDRRIDELTLLPSAARVGVHLACTQRNVVRRSDAEIRLLQRIPGLQLCDPAPATCCGAAGVQALRFPAQAEQRLGALRDWYLAQAPELLLAGNLGCRLHLARRLDPAGMLANEHPLTFFARHLP